MKTLNHIEKSKFMIENCMKYFFNTAYLNKLDDQRERSMIGQRTSFLEFHRYIYNLTDQQIYKCWEKYKEEFRDASIKYPDSNFCDLDLLCDAIQFQIALRDDKQASLQIAEEIAMSFVHNRNIAKQFEEITSNHLISYVEKWLNE